MKKFLLFIATGVLAISSMMAITDGQTYQQVGDYKLVNDWVISRVHSGELNFSALPIANNYARRATIYNGEVLIAQTCSPQHIYAINDTTNAMQCVIYRYSLETGEYLGDLPLTLDGEPYGNTAQASLLANNIGVDHFGHLWLAQYTSEATREFTLYLVDMETGALESQGVLTKAKTAEEVCARIDYIDVMGDITREEEQCNVMGAGASSDLIYRWHADQGSEWEPGFDGEDYYIQITQFPRGWDSETQSSSAEITSWGFAPFVKMCLGEDESTLYDAELFWVDGFYSAPALYTLTGDMYDTFNNVESFDLQPEEGTNGLTEFHLDGKNFMIYSIAQYQGNGHGCQANIVELDESLALESMVKYWQIPADSLGHTSDGGIRIHSIEAIPGVDEDGNEYVTILTYKCQNGFGIYRMGKNVKPYGDEQEQDGIRGDVDKSGIVDVDDMNALINIMLGFSSASDYPGVTDLTEDGIVDVDDVNVVINIMLGL